MLRFASYLLFWQISLLDGLINFLQVACLPLLFSTIPAKLIALSYLLFSWLCLFGAPSSIQKSP